MRTKAKYVVGLRVVQIVALCGCSPQRALAHRLKGADRVIVTNTAEGLSISITGEEVDKIVQAIATAKKESPLIDAAVGKGTEKTHVFVMEFVDEAALKDYADSPAQKEWYKTYLPIREASTTFDITN